MSGDGGIRFVDSQWVSIDLHSFMRRGITVTRTVTYNGTIISFTFERKAVKNINLRVRTDGTVYVSANRRVPVEYIDQLVLENGGKILASVEKFRKEAENAVETIEYPEEYVRRVFGEIVGEIYPAFAKYGVDYPTLRIRKMKSRWGSCIPAKGIITLNTKLMAYSRRCIEYVVVHEFCHFMEANHSVRFYEWLTMMMPDWQERKAELARRL